MKELTEQELRVFRFFMEGLSMKELALHEGVSYSRIINILNSILLKTGNKNRRELLINGLKLLEKYKK